MIGMYILQNQMASWQETFLMYPCTVSLQPHFWGCGEGGGGWGTLYSCLKNNAVTNYLY